MDAIMEIAREFDLLVVEDAAQAIGAVYPRADAIGSAGTIGDVGCFSFYTPMKFVAAGDAGASICDNENLATRFRICRQHGMEPRYRHQFIGGNFRLDELQAAILQVKLPHLANWSATRRAAADFYREEFSRHKLGDSIILPSEPYRERIGNHHIYHQFVIRAEAQAELRTRLTRNAIS